MSGGLGYALRIAAFYGALFLYIGVYVPFFPVYLSALGLTATQIGLVMALPLVIRIAATPVMTWLADRAGNASAVLCAYAWGVLATTLTYLLARDFAAVALAVSINAVFLNPVMPITEALALRGVRIYALDYGRMRLAGSATFIIGNLAGGAVLASQGGQSAIWMMIGAAAAMALCGFLLPAASDGAANHDRVTRPGLLVSLRASAGVPALLVMSGFALTLGSHNLFYVFGTIHWASQGIGTDMAGPLWAIGVVAEIMLFAFSGIVGARLEVRGLMLLGLAAALVRWGAMAFDPPLALLFPLQALHGLTFGAMHLAAMRYLGQTAPPGQSSSLQGVYFMLTGMAASIINLAAGPLYAGLGGGGYLVMAVIAATGAGLVLAGLRRSSPVRSTP